VVAPSALLKAELWHNSKMLKAVLFDVDGVLIDSKKSNAYFFKRLLVHAGYPEPAEQDILDSFHMSLRQTIERLTGTGDPSEVERIVDIVKAGQLRSIDVNLIEFPNKLEDVLEELHKKYRLGIVTNRLRIGVDDIFNLRQIEHLFEIVVTVEDYQNPKPHPEPLLVALEKLGVSAGEAVYIGDTHADVAAANAAGMKVIHVAMDTHPGASAGVKEFSELIEVIESLL
jgi:pyrophosphatase PpaX